MEQASPSFIPEAADSCPLDIHLPGEDRKRLAALITSRFRSLLGRGPVNVKIRVAGSEVTVVLHGFLTPLEKTLLGRGRNRELVLCLRERLLKEMYGDWEEILAEVGLGLRSIDGRTDLDRNKRTFVLRVRSLSWADG